MRLKTNHTCRILVALLSTLTTTHASIFSGGVPVPPANAPGGAELILINTTVQGPIGMDVREEFDFFMEGTFYNTGTGLNEDYTMNTVSWGVTESAQPAAGLEIDEDGGFIARAYPSVSYPRTVSIDASSTEGAPLDSESQPIEFSDSQSLEISRESTDLDYDEWISGETSLTGDDALEAADPDEDNSNNLLEFGLGTDPEDNDTATGFSHSHDIDEDESTFTLTIPKERDEVTYTIETTSDLTTEPIVWTPQALEFFSDDGDSETWQVIVSGSDSLFGRLSIETYKP